MYLVAQACLSCRGEHGEAGLRLVSQRLCHFISASIRCGIIMRCDIKLLSLGG